jgi:hypothetical protein
MTDQSGYPQNSPWGPQQPYPSIPQQPSGQNQWPTPPPGYGQPAAGLQQPGYQQSGYQQPTYQQPGYEPQWQQPQPPRKRGSKLLIGCGSSIGLLVVIIIIAAVASSTNNGVTKDSSTGPSAAASQAPSQSNNSLTGPIGTTFTVTDTTSTGGTAKYSVTLDKVIQHARPDNSFDTAPAGDHLAAAEFTIKGIAGDDQDDANDDATAIGHDQQTYQPGFEGLAAGTNFSSGQFNTSPGSASIGWVSFEVKNRVKVASIQWSPSAGFSGSAPATWTVLAG